VDVLAGAGQTRWQILPLGPTDSGGSPYGCCSAFAGNPLLVSPEQLVIEGMLDRTDIAAAELPAGPVRFDRVAKVKQSLFLRAWQRFQARSSAEFDRFCATEKGWLDDYALFRAIAEKQKSFDWAGWPRPLARRQKAAIGQAARELAAEIRLEQFKQYLFHRHWNQLRRYANDKGIQIIGDVPMFVSGNSSDVWVHPEHFLLDRNLRPTVVAGVPPDYFSNDGQRWGNPLFNWKAMAADGFAWWVDRIRSLTRQTDIVRIDHFRGLAACWHVPADQPTAKKGRWVKSPGEPLLSAVLKKIGSLPLIAEDLGLITTDVEALRDQFDLPGMRVMQFGFGSNADDPFLPHNFVGNCVAYTGTHDNDTTAGWWRTLDRAGRKRASAYVPGIAKDPAGALSRAVLASVADTAIIPAQDVLGLGSSHRMNRPGDSSGNWRWRLEAGYDKSPRWNNLAEMTAAYGRVLANA
jgi:4-alpha-glucanotransferase